MLLSRLPSRAQALIIIRQYPQGPRCWIAGYRIHHGATGLALALALHKCRRARWVALALVAHDWHDWRRWFAREHFPLDSSS